MSPGRKLSSHSRQTDRLMRALRHPRFFRHLGARLWTIRGTLFLAGFLVLATILVYAQTVRFGFMTVDDPIYVSENPHVQAGVTLGNLTWCFSAFYESNWIPFTWLSLMLDTTLFGRGPAGYHVTNLLLHSANTLLLFRFLTRATGKILPSAWVAAMFALHPLHVESVAWITERKDVLSTLFGFLALLAYVRYASGGSGWAFAASILCFVFSLLAKQTLVTLPFVLLLLDFWPLGRLAGRVTNAAGWRRRIAVEKLPFFAVSGVFSAIAVVAQAHSGTVRDLKQFPLAERVMNAIFVYAAYLAKTFFPHDLAVFYPHLHQNLAPTSVGLAAVLLLAITAAVMLCVRRYPFLFVGWFWYLGTLVPLIGLVQIGAQQMADRYTYFPLIGIFIAIAWLFSETTPAGALRTRFLPAAAIATVLIAGAAGFRQTRLWRDNVTLLQHAKDCTADNFRVHQYLGSALLGQGSVGEALGELRIAVRMDPSSAAAHSALGNALQASGRLDEAAKQYEAALLINEQDADVHCNLGVIQLKRREYAVAKRNFRRALEIDPYDVAANVNLGTLCLETGQYAEALACSRRALEVDSRSIRGRHNLALALIAHGRLDEAIAQFQQLSALAPDDRETRENLARALALKRAPSAK